MAARSLEATGTWQDPQIMVIDDSMAVRRIVEMSFARVGLHAVSFADGMEAITALTQGTVSVPDLLLLDIGMPKMDGYEVASILRSNAACRNMIIVMLTGRDGILDKIRSFKIGARDYIHKPFRPRELILRVCRHLDIVPPNIADGGPASGEL